MSSLTYFGYSAVQVELTNLRVYIDPYFTSPGDLANLQPGHLVLFSHGHFDHGVLLTPKLYEMWKCQFVAPKALVNWLRRKYKKKVPAEAFLPLDVGQSLYYGDTKITAVPALHPLNRLGKTIMAMFARSRAPGKPVNGYYFEGYYHAGATIYSADIAKALVDHPVHTAFVPIGGKYATASPEEALRIAEELNAKRLVPMHWQPLGEQVFYRYQPSHLMKLAKDNESRVEVLPLAIGQRVELQQVIK